jgi:hypothetical protein
MLDGYTFDLRGANIGNLADTVHGNQVAAQHVDASEQNFEFLLTDFQQFINAPALHIDYPCSEQFSNHRFFSCCFNQVSRRSSRACCSLLGRCCCKMTDQITAMNVRAITQSFKISRSIASP